jgi:regulatory protein
VTDTEEISSSDEYRSVDIRRSAMNYLARREYSRYELSCKLLHKFAVKNLVEQVVEELVADNLLSDERFAEVFVRSRVSRGIGPNRIRRELSERGVNRELVEVSMEGSATDWSSLRTEVLKKRFGSIPAVDREEKAKRLRFMYQRGFHMTPDDL